MPESPKFLVQIGAGSDRICAALAKLGAPQPGAAMFKAPAPPAEDHEGQRGAALQYAVPVNHGAALAADVPDTGQLLCHRELAPDPDQEYRGKRCHGFQDGLPVSAWRPGRRGGWRLRHPAHRPVAFCRDRLADRCRQPAS
ncbi:hypothetical protein ACU4GD_07275 [Cupriavidus basilensis]